MKNLEGVWVGKDSVIVITENLQLAFLRLKKELICSILKYSKLETYSIVYGEDINANAKSEAILVNGNKEVLQTSEKMIPILNNHLEDKVCYDEKENKLVYTMYDGTVYNNELAEKIDDSMFTKENPIDNTLSLIQKMQNWNIYQQIEIIDNGISINIHTGKYAICYHMIFDKSTNIYCRFGQHGYSNKGWAMLSTICLRPNEVRMVDNNLISLNDYIPNEEYFLNNGCTFPEDGGWYWSIIDETENILTFQGCSGEIYKIYREK